jgi:hypothetical protein
MKHILIIGCSYVKDEVFMYYHRTTIQVPPSGSMIQTSWDGVLPKSISIQETLKRGTISAPLVLYSRDPRRYITGLKPLGDGYYYGDTFRDVKSLIIINRPSLHRVHLWLFPNHYPRSITMAMNDFLNQMRSDSMKGAR